MRQKEIIAKMKAMRVRNVSPDEAIAILKKNAPDILWNENYIRTLPAGTVVGAYKNRCLVIQRVFIKPFTLGYSAHKGSKQGEELLISSFRLPRSINKSLKQLCPKKK